MPDQNTPRLALRLTLILGAILALVGAAWLLVLATTSIDTATTADRPMATPTITAVPAEPTAEAATDQSNRGTTTAPQSTATAESDTTGEPEPTATGSGDDRWTGFTLVTLDETDLGTGSVEFSAVALNEDTNRMIIAEDGDRLFEFDLSATGEPITPPRRTITVDVGAGDVEGLAWISGSTFAIATENDGHLQIVEIDDDATSIGPAELRETIDTGIREDNGSGLEGVTVRFDRSVGDMPAFAVIDERPPALYLLGDDGAVESVTPLDLGVADVSDLWTIGERSFLVLSHEGRHVFLVDISDDGSIDHRSVLDLTFDDGHFEQPEGIVVSRDGARLYVVGEAPGSGRFSFGLWLIE